MNIRRRLLLLLLLLMPLNLGCPGKNHAQKGQPVSLNTTSQTTGTGPICFEDRYPTSGIDFRLGHGGRTPLTIQDTIGHGIALLDFDGDGLLDIVMTGPDKVRLYKNLGNFRFQDVTQGSGLRQKGYWTGIAVADVDNDGKPDLFLSAKGDEALYRNLGGGHFQEMTDIAGMRVTDPNRWNSAALFFDYDHDGRPDLFVGAYVNLGTHSGLCPSGGYTMACGPQDFEPQKGVLYHNLGNWHFEKCDISAQTHGKVLGLIAGDLYGDGGVELYIANDVMEADMLRYAGKGRWEAVGTKNGTNYNSDGRAMGGMGVSVADYDGDGKLDLAVGTFCRDPRSLFHYDGGGQYSNRAFASGIVGPSTFFVAFGTQFVDLDNDGWPDLVMVNGHVQDQVTLVDPQIHYAEPTQVFHNLGNGRFEDVAATAGPAIARPIVGRSLCVGDLDNDGKMDLVVGDLEGAPLILRNISPAGNWLRVKLVGKHACRDGQGAVVTCFAGGRAQVKLATTGGSYFSASDPRVHFGLGQAQQVERITVRWPGGKTQSLPNPGINREIVIEEQ